MKKGGCDPGSLVVSLAVALGLSLCGCGATMENVSPRQAMALIDDGVYLLDVRTPPEYAAGHIAGAALIPVQELEARVSELADHKGKPVLVYCRSGRRSAIAVKILRRAGFGELFDLERGLIAWKRENLPLTRV